MRSRARAALVVLGLTVASCSSCGPPPATRTGPPPERFRDALRGVSLDPPPAPFARSDTGAASSVVHFADPDTRAGLHVLAFPSAGASADLAAVEPRVQAYLRGLGESVAGLSVRAVRALLRFGLHGVEIEYEGGPEPRMMSIDWVLYAPGRVYVVKITAPRIRFGELSGPLVRARDSLHITASQPDGRSLQPDGRSVEETQTH